MLIGPMRLTPADFAAAMTHRAWAGSRDALQLHGRHHHNRNPAVAAQQRRQLDVLLWKASRRKSAQKLPSQSPLCLLKYLYSRRGQVAVTLHLVNSRYQEKECCCKMPVTL